MSYKKLICPNCTAPFPPITGRKIIACEYCGSKFVLDSDLEEAVTEEADRIRENEYREKQYEAEQREKQRSYEEKQREKSKWQEEYDKKKKQLIIAGVVFVLSISFEEIIQIRLLSWCILISLVIVIITGKQMYEMKEQTKTSVPLASTKRKWTAFLLCFFLGMFGVHHFYVGRVGKGLLYLFTGGLFGIGVLYDLIIILLGTFKDKNGYVLIL